MYKYIYCENLASADGEKAVGDTGGRATVVQRYVIQHKVPSLVFSLVFSLVVSLAHWRESDSVKSKA